MNERLFDELLSAEAFLQEIGVEVKHSRIYTKGGHQDLHIYLSDRFKLFKRDVDVQMTIFDKYNWQLVDYRDHNWMQLGNKAIKKVPLAYTGSLQELVTIWHSLDKVSNQMSMP